MTRRRNTLKSLQNENNAAGAGNIQYRQGIVRNYKLYICCFSASIEQGYHPAHTTGSIDKEFALLVVVTSSGILKDTVIRVPDGIDGDFLNKVSNILNDKYRGKTFSEIDLKEVSKIKEVFARNQKFFNSLVDVLTHSLRAVQDKEVYLGGTANIFKLPEFQDIFKARSFLSLLEEKDLLYDVLASSQDDGVKVSIGAENHYDEFKECSIVTATHSLGDRVLAP